MPKVVMLHAVEEIDRWLAGREERTAAIEGMGGSDLTEFVAADGSGAIAITADVADLDSLMATLAAPPPEMLAQMQGHGVIPPLTVYVQA